MPDWERILWPAAAAVVGAVAFIVRPLVQRFFVETVSEQARAITESSQFLVYYAPWYANPGTGKPEDMKAASDALRQNASRLIAATNAIPWYGLLRVLTAGRLPPRASVMEAARNLIGLSNSVHQGHPEENLERRAQIEKALRLRLR